MPIKFVSQLDVKGKTIVLRCDLNSNVENGTIIVSDRIKQHAQTIRQLSGEGARLVVLAHQGRKREKDFVSLEQHCVVLEKLLGKKIKFIKWTDNFASEIGLLKDSETILMENTRFLEEETIENSAAEHSKTDFVKKIASFSDYFVLDALSVCHRSQASVVGFTALLPSFAGPVLERELNALKKISSTKEKRLLVLGGAKPAESIEVLESMLSKGNIDEALLGGLLAELFWKSQGIKFGAKDIVFEEKKLLGLLPKCAKLLQAFSEQIFLPLDFAVEENGNRKIVSLEQLPSDEKVLDIGDKTIDLFCKQIDKAKLIVFNGPLGVFEQKDFAVGTKKVLETISRSVAFSILGGGDTETALDMLGIDKKLFGFVSLSGKALLEYLAGKQLPGLAALGASK